MKKIFLLILIIFSCGFSVIAQEKETAKPMFDTEIVRKVPLLDLEGNIYNDVVMTFKAKSPERSLYLNYIVKVTIKDINGNLIWKKTLKNVYLYVFSDGQIQVGKPNFDQIIVYSKTDDKKAFAIVREKEGVY